MVENANIYGIISKGIHELSEEDCIKYFPIMKEGILLIAEKWEEERKRNELEKELTKSIGKIAGDVK